MKAGLIDRIKSWVINTQLWKSVLRHDYEDTDRSRALITFTNVLYHLHPVKVRKEALKLRYTWCMGGTTFFLFIILTITGVMLMFYYIPDTRRAYEDIKDIMQVVAYGDIMRNMHRWAAHGMVFTVWFHMTRVFLTGSYKPPREFNWVVGVVLLVCTLLLSWTGYLLPWDQLALWAITVGTKMAAATPLIGVDGPFGKELGVRVDNDVTFMLLGGTVVGQNALLRFYVLHCIVLPLIVTVFLAVHFWRIRKDGFSGPL